MNKIVVFMTTTTKREAKKITHTLLAKHYIACANILGPLESEFWWKEKIDKAKEFLVIMKSDEKLFDKLSKTIKEMHSYEVPEIFALPLINALPQYFEWLNNTLSLVE
jgi:periplasmic divalent cation tolerance protein